MTVNTTSITSGPYTGNGVTTSFPYTFKAFTDANVIVYHTVDTVQSTLTLGTHYSVTGTGVDGGGNVVMTTAPASGDEIYIRSNYSAEQLTDFDSQGGFYPDTHEDAFDKQTMLIQQLEDVQGRGLRLPLSDSSGVMPELSPDPLKLLRWNAAGDAVENVDITLIDPDAVATDILVYTVETFAALATTPATTAGMVVCIKQHTSGGIGGGHFQDTSGTITNDGGTLINNTITAGRHWKRISYPFTIPQFWGVIGDGVADDTVACQLAINSGAACLHWPQGVYNISAAGLTGVTGQRWVGAGIGLTTIKATAAPTSDFIFFAAKNTIDISGITFDGNGLLTSTVAGHFPGIQPCIHFSQCNAVKVDRCQFIGFYTSGCFGNACHDVDIMNSIATRSTAVGELINYGIHFSGSVGNESYNIRIDKCTATRVNIALNAFNSTVSNCIVSGWAFSSGVIGRIKIEVVNSRSVVYKTIISVNRAVFTPVFNTIPIAAIYSIIRHSSIM